MATLNDVFRARVHVKWAGKDFDQFRRDLSNGCMSRSREMPFDATEAGMQIANYKSVLAFKKKTEEIRGTQHLSSESEIDGDSGEVAGSQHYEDGEK